MTTETELLTIEKIYIKLPSHFRSADFRRLQQDLKGRNKVYGQFSPVLTRKNFPVIDQSAVSHYFTDFKENGEKFWATLVVLNTEAGKALIASAKDSLHSLIPKRRMNNDPWILNGKTYGAPGFFAIDLAVE